MGTIMPRPASLSSTIFAFTWVHLCRQIGLKAASRLSQHWISSGELQASSEFLHPEDRERILSEVRAWLEGTEDEIHLEARLVSASGDVRTFSWTNSYTMDPRGRRVGIRNIGRDISDLSAMAAALDGLTHALDAALPIARGGLGELPQLLDFCRGVLEDWSGTLPTDNATPVRKLLTAGKRLIEALQESVPRT